MGSKSVRAQKVQQQVAASHANHVSQKSSREQSGADKASAKFGIVLPIVLLSYFLILLNNSLVFTSNLAIAQEFNMDSVSVSWVSNAYGLTFGGFLLLAGRLGDLFGRKKLLSTGLVIFAVSSLFVGLAPNAGVLIAMRAVQGIGAALLTPATLALLIDTYEGEMQTRAVAYYGTVAGIGGALGMVIGGVIASYASWHYGFFLDVPVAVGLLVLTLCFVKTDHGVMQGSIDWAGSILSVIGFSALVYAISGTAYRELAAGIAVSFLLAFVLVERRAKTPVVPLDLFASMGRTGAYADRFLLWGASMAYFFMMPTAMQNVFGFTALQSAVAFLPLSIAQFVFALLVPRVVARLSNAWTVVLGSVVIVAGYFLGWMLGMRAGYTLGVALPMIIIGAGQGLAVTPLTVAGVEGARPQDAGAASGVVNVAAQIGGAVGLALISTRVSGLEPEQSMVTAEGSMMLLMLIGVASAVFVLISHYASRHGHAQNGARRKLMRRTRSINQAH